MRREVGKDALEQLGHRGDGGGVKGRLADQEDVNEHSERPEQRARRG